MEKKSKEIVRELIPPLLLKLSKGMLYGWHGNFPSWNKALEKSDGYDSEIILEKVKSAILKVRQGEAAFERDSVLFDKKDYSFPLLTGLMWISSRNSGRLKVLDFGGSLGSTYFQNRTLIDSLNEVRWCVVEQPGFVKTGIELLQDDKLRFYYSIEECLRENRIDVVLLSSVLQYLDEPYELLDLVVSAGIEYLIIDRTPFIAGPDRITIQKVNPKIYRGSYPCWFFNEEKFVARLRQDFNIVLEFAALDKANITSRFKGFILQRIKK